MSASTTRQKVKRAMAPPHTPSNGNMLFEIYQNFGELKGQVTSLIGAQGETVRHRAQIEETLIKLNTNTALLNQEMQRLAPIVTRLEAHFNQHQGIGRIGRGFANLASGAVGGTVLATFISWLFHHN